MAATSSRLASGWRSSSSTDDQRARVERRERLPYTDRLSQRGFAARYRFFDRWPLTLRLAAGLGRGEAGAAVGGTVFWTLMGGPEVRFGHRFGRGLVVDAGAGAILLLLPNTVATGIVGDASGTRGGTGVLFPA